MDLEPLNASFTEEDPNEIHAANQCNVCAKTLKSKSSLTRHFNLHKPGLICRVCCKAFESTEVFDKHKREKHSDTFLCSVCGKSFNRRSAYNAHNKTHFEKVEVCPYDTCGKSFINKHMLADHLNTHTGKKPYTCTRCRRSYSTQPSFCHQKSVCMRTANCDQCDKSFSSRSSRFDHQQSEHEVLWFTCACGKKYRWRVNLARHRRTCNLARD